MAFKNISRLLTRSLSAFPTKRALVKIRAFGSAAADKARYFKNIAAGAFQIGKYSTTAFSYFIAASGKIIPKAASILKGLKSGVYYRKTLSKINQGFDYADAKWVSQLNRLTNRIPGLRNVNFTSRGITISLGVGGAASAALLAFKTRLVMEHDDDESEDAKLLLNEIAEVASEATLPNMRSSVLVDYPVDRSVSTDNQISIVNDLLRDNNFQFNNEDPKQDIAIKIASLKDFERFDFLRKILNVARSVAEQSDSPEFYRFLMNQMAISPDGVNDWTEGFEYLVSSRFIESRSVAEQSIAANNILVTELSRLQNEVAGVTFLTSSIREGNAPSEFEGHSIQIPTVNEEMSEFATLFSCSGNPATDLYNVVKALQPDEERSKSLTDDQYDDVIIENIQAMDPFIYLLNPGTQSARLKAYSKLNKAFDRTALLKGN